MLLAVFKLAAVAYVVATVAMIPYASVSESRLAATFRRFWHIP